MTPPDVANSYAEALRNDVEARLKPIEEDAAKLFATWKEQADDRARAFQRETEALSQQASQIFRESSDRLSAIERESRESIYKIVKDVTDQVQAKATSMVTIIVGVVMAAILSLAFLATKDVNSSVIGLQNTVIATQATIKQADKDLAEQSKKLTEASNEISKKLAELSVTEGKLKAATAQLDKTQSDLEKVRANVESAVKR